MHNTPAHPIYNCACVIDSPVALISSLTTSTVISVDEGLLNINWISTTSLFSSMIYTG